MHIDLNVEWDLAMLAIIYIHEDSKRILTRFHSNERSTDELCIYSSTHARTIATTAHADKKDA